MLFNFSIQNGSECKILALCAKKVLIPTGCRGLSYKKKKNKRMLGTQMIMLLVLLWLQKRSCIGNLQCILIHSEYFKHYKIPFVKYINYTNNTKMEKCNLE